MLENLCKVKRFNFTVMFLSESEKEGLFVSFKYEMAKLEGYFPDCFHFIVLFCSTKEAV